MDNNRPKISFILPCYNMAEYIHRCVESIYDQNLDFQFEIIAVNDASTDNTLEILANLQSQFKELKIINHDTNCKLTGARTTGIWHAQGEYIMHVDPDDYLLPHSLDKIFEDNPGNWDILIANFIVDSGNGENRLRYNLSQNYFNMSIPSDRKTVFNNVVKGACYAKLFRRQILEDLIYYTYQYNIGEDRAFNLEVFSKAKTVAYYHKPIYYYQLFANSLSHSGFNPAIITWDNCWAHNIIDLYKLHKLSPEALRAARSELERNSIGHLLRIRKQPNCKELYEQWKLFLQEQLCLFRPKTNWYKLLLKCPRSIIADYIFLLSAINKGALIDRLKKFRRHDD